MKRLSILATLIALAATGRANTVLFDFPIAESNTEIAQSGILGLFDSNLGTLNAITLILRGSSTSTISLSLSANSTSPQVVTGTASVDLFFDTSIDDLDNLLLLNGAGISLSSSTGPQTLQPGQTASFGPFTDSDAQSFNVFGLQAQLSQTGGGSFTVDCSSLSGLGIAGGGGLANGSQATTAGCGGTIVYDFTPSGTPVPEPATLALVGLALAGLGRSAKRRNSLTASTEHR